MRNQSVRPRVRRHIEQAARLQVLPRLDLLDSTILAFERTLHVTLTIQERALLVRCTREQFQDANDNHSHAASPRASLALNASAMGERSAKWRAIYRR
jgi:hypothetical protein